MERTYLNASGANRATVPVVWTIAALSLGFSLWAVHIGWHNSVYDFHPFRQAQTAISAESIRNGGPILRYETPVMGPPWSIPLEFPLYQALVAGVSKLFAAGIDPAGRFVSICFFYLCLFPLASIMSSLGLRRVQIVPALALFVANPFYVFISRLVMIESTALFFSLAYLSQVLIWARAPEEDRAQWRHILLAALCGVIAGAVKLTTFTPYLLLAMGAMVWSWFRQRRSRKLLSKQFLAVLALCFALPAAATVGWTKFADSVKLHNPIAAAELTSSSLHAWTFGTLAQRLNYHCYYWIHWNLKHAVGIPALCLVLLLTLIFHPRSLWVMGLAVAAYIAAAETFLNLYIIHIYYPYAITVLLLLGLGYIFGSFLRLQDKRAWLGVALLVVTLASGVWGYRRDFYFVQKNNAPGSADAAAWIDSVTRPSDVILIFGMGYSPELPYQAQRRAIMATYTSLQNHTLQKAIDKEGTANIAAVAVCWETQVPTLPQYLSELGMPAKPLAHLDRCYLYRRD